MASEDEHIKTGIISKKSLSVAKDIAAKEVSGVNLELNIKELEERKLWKENEDATPYLYPDFNDPLFNAKIASNECKAITNSKH